MRAVPYHRCAGLVPEPNEWKRRRLRARYAVPGRSLELSEWQEQSKDGAFGLALKLDETAVAGHELLSDREPQAGAVGTSRDQRIENAGAKMVGHTRPVVFDFDARHQAMARGSDTDIGQRAGAQSDPSAVTDRLQCIACNIQQCLDDLMPIQH